MWTLIWNDLALDELAVPYVAADPARQAQIAGAVEKLNARLRNDPLSEGESREPGNRITFVAGLAVGFRLDPAAREVRVTRVGTSGRPG
jgi:hypothetical protein